MPRRRRHAPCSLAGIVLLVAACLASVNCAGVSAVRRSEADRPRDSRTGVLVGAEPVVIDGGRRGACLLLHGWITSPADFGALPEALDAAGWDVYAPLHAGHGTTPRDLRGIRADRLLEPARGHYAALRKRYGRVVLVGFSMGGAIATILAADEPPDRLVLVAPFCGVRHKWYYVLPARCWHALVSPVLRWAPRSRSLESCNREAGRAPIVTYYAFPIDASRALFDLRRRLLSGTDLSRLTMPALLVYSSGDQVCSPGAMARFFARLPAEPRRTAVFAHSNHHLLLDHDGEQAIQAIVDFVGKP